MGRLEGKIALITGTGGSQGRGAALRFAAEGAWVVGCDRDASADEETVKLVSEAGGKMVSLAPLDLSDESEVARWFEFATASCGDFDILYNNASGCRFATIEAMTREDWDYTLANELTLVFLAIKHAVAVFRRRGGGVILNTASTSAILGSGYTANAPGAAAHAVTKAGVIALGRALAVELAPYNIRVNTLTPGGIDGPNMAPLLADPEIREMILQKQLISRLGRPEDTAAAAAFLCSDEASYITGVSLVIDGGLTAAGGAGLPGTTYGQQVPKNLPLFEYN
jgi:NAD(P)-dependent dehydrogenase (short-subunit alcohol dehydrogenase family)